MNVDNESENCRNVLLEARSMFFRQIWHQWQMYDLINFADFYPRDAVLALVFSTATCPSVCPSRAGIVSRPVAPRF